MFMFIHFHMFLTLKEMFFSMWNPSLCWSHSSHATLRVAAPARSRCTEGDHLNQPASGDESWWNIEKFYEKSWDLYTKSMILTKTNNLCYKLVKNLYGFQDSNGLVFGWLGVLPPSFYDMLWEILGHTNSFNGKCHGKFNDLVDI
jgi:hypothetical protein